MELEEKLRVVDTNELFLRSHRVSSITQTCLKLMSRSAHLGMWKLRSLTRSRRVTRTSSSVTYRLMTSSESTWLLYGFGYFTQKPDTTSSQRYGNVNVPKYSLTISLYLYQQIFVVVVVVVVVAGLIKRGTDFFVRFQILYLILYSLYNFNIIINRAYYKMS